MRGVLLLEAMLVLVPVVLVLLMLLAVLAALVLRVRLAVLVLLDLLDLVAVTSTWCNLSLSMFACILGPVRPRGPLPSPP